MPDDFDYDAMDSPDPGADIDADIAAIGRDSSVGTRQVISWPAAGPKPFTVNFGAVPQGTMYQPQGDRPADGARPFTVNFGAGAAQPGQSGPSTTSAFIHGAERGALPAAGAMAGAGFGAETGAALGAPLGPIGVAGGALAGGVAGAYFGSDAVARAQDWVMAHLPQSALKFIGQDQQTQQAEQAAHPYASFAGQLAPNLAVMSPLSAGRTATEGMTAMQRIASSPVTARAFGAGMMAGQEAASEAASGQPVDPTKVAIAGGAGALMGRPTRFGEAVSEIGAQAARRMPGRLAPATPATPSPLPDDQQAAMSEALALPPPPRRLTYQPDQTQGTGFTLSPDSTFAPPVQPQLEAPPRRLALPAPDINRGAQGDGFTIEPATGDTDNITPAGPATPQQFRPTSPMATEEVHPVEQAASAAEEPTPAQAEAGNYQKGHLRVQGLDVTIETPKGAVRRGPIDETTGEPAWQAVMPAHYGYIKGTIGGDGEQVDVQLGPRTKALFDGTPAQIGNDPVYVVDQIDPQTGKFDEHKALVGFHTGAQAVRAYDDSFTDGSGPSRRGAVTEMSFDAFKDWLKNGDTTKPVAYKKPTVSDQLKARRQLQKQRMAEPMTVGLVKRDQVRAPLPEPDVEEEVPENEAAAEVAAQPQVFEKEGEAPTTVVDRGTPVASRSTKTTNLDDRLIDIERAVVNGDKTVEDADREFGLRGGKARPENRSLDAWLRHRIDKLSDPDSLAQLVEKARRLQEDRTLTSAKRKAASREINRAIAAHDPEYVEKLRSTLEDLENYRLRDEEERAERRRATLDKLDKIRNRPAGLERGKTSEMLRDRRINRPIRDLLAEMRQVPISEYFDRIANDQVIKTRLPQYVALVRQLQKILPADLPVFPHYLAAAIYNDAKNIGSDERAGGYHPTHNIIFLNPLVSDSERAPLETLLHEATHAAITRYLRKEPLKSHAVIDAIADEMERNLPTDASFELRYALGHEFPDAKDLPPAHLRILRNDELVTMLMTNPEVGEFAQGIVPSSGFRARMRALGYDGPQPPRSVWKAFTYWVRKVLGLPSGPSDSLIDHILRPIQDVIARADKFNRGEYRFLNDLPSELRRPAAETADAIGHAIAGLRRLDSKEARQQVYRAIDFGKLGDRARKVLLQWVPSDGIVWWNKDLFDPRDGSPTRTNSLEDWRRSVESIAERSKKFRDKWTDTLHDLISRAAKLPDGEGDNLAKLMNDATLAEVALGNVDPAANAHLVKPEQQQALRQLQARYAALSQGGRALYDGFRDYYAKTYAEERVAQFKSLAKIAIPDATGSQIRELAQALRTMRGIRQLINNPDTSPVAQAFADAWHSKRALVRLIAQVHSKGFVRGDYFPLRRFGDYVVHYGTKGTDDYGVEMFDNKWDADQRRAELQREGAEPSQVLDKRAYSDNLRGLLPNTTVMSELDAALRQSSGLSGSDADTVKDLFASILLQHASRSEAARSRMRRQGVKGASTDFKRTAARDFLSLGSRMGYLEYGPDRVNAEAAMRRHVDWLGRPDGVRDEQIRANAVLHEIEMRRPAGDDNSGAWIGNAARRASGFGFVYSLLTPSTMLTHAVETHTNAASFLGSRHGFGAAGLALTKALKEIAPSVTRAGVSSTLTAGRSLISASRGLRQADWNLSHLVRDKLIKAGADREGMFRLEHDLNAAGLIEHSMVRELRRIASPGINTTAAGAWWGKFMDFNAAMQNAVSIANRWAVAKAAYDLELRRTGDDQAARAYAVEQTRRVMPNYNLKPRIATRQGALGSVGGPIMQFKLYGLHMYSVMANLVKEGIHGASSAERNEAWRAFAGIMATHALMAGMLTLPFIAEPLRYLGGAYSLLRYGQLHDYQNDVRLWLAHTFGHELGEIIARGVPHLAGIDIHRRVGLANLLEVPELESLDKAGFAELVVDAMAGVAGADARQLAQSLVALRQGNPAALTGLVPVRIVRDLLKANTLATSGVTDSKGRTILSPDRLSGADIAAQAAGFQPSRVTEFREGREAILDARMAAQEERSGIINRFVAASPSERRGVMRDMQAYNRDHPESPITYAQLLQATRREVRRTQNPASFGLQLPRRAAQRLEGAGAFANVR